MIIELVISLKMIKFMIIWQWRIKLQHRMIPNKANNIYETNENSYFSEINCNISYLLLVATYFCCCLCLSYRQTSLKRNKILKTLLKHSEYVQAWWHQIDKNFVHEGLCLTLYLPLGWPAMPPHVVKRILLCLHTVACTIPMILHKGGSRGGDWAIVPLKPTKVTFFNKILYKFGKQNSRYKAISPSFVFSQQHSEVYFISLTVVNP